jgi:hypothetical protein
MALFALCIASIALVRSYPLLLALLALAGASSLAMQSGMSSGLQSSSAPEVRGRVMALFILAHMGGTPIAGLAFGALAQFVGVPLAIVAGAVACLAWAGVLTVRGDLLASLA